MGSTEILGHLTRSQIYQDYERAFSAATSLPLCLRPPKTWALVQHGKKHENPFCAMLAESGHGGCAACLALQEKIADPAAKGAVSATCFAGLCDTAVPVRVGEKLAGYLQTGQVALQPPTRKKFRRIAQRIVDWGIQVDLRKLEEAYFHSQVLTPERYAGAVRMLEIFASHIGSIGHQLAIQEGSTESPLTRRAKAYVADHQADDLSLAEVAQALHVSTFYFCKMFKKATGLTFTDYLGRVRIERAKVLLADSNKRISEVAYEVGFGSLTHFNRLFRKLVGQSPTVYREKLPLPAKKAK